MQQCKYLYCHFLKKMNASLPNKSINFFLKIVLTTNVWIYTHTYILINIYNLLHCILEFQNLQIMLINFKVQVDYLSKPWLILLTESITVATVILAAVKAKNTRFRCAPDCVCCVWCNV